jgi:hypothetical protein
MRPITKICFGIVILAGVALAQSPQLAAPETASPSEPGMYVCKSGGFTKIIGQIVTFERSGSLLAFAATGGFKAAHKNVQLLGAHAQTVVESKPVFYFIPAKQEADAGVDAGDIVLVHLEEKLVRSQDKPGTYKITPAAALDKGEYALYLTRGEGMQPYIYDFSVQ